MNRAMTLLVITASGACTASSDPPRALTTLMQAVTLAEPGDFEVVEFEPLVSYNFNEPQTLHFDSSVVGEAQVFLELWANAGSIESEFPEGVEVTIGDNPPCPSEIRYWYNEQGCQTLCTVTVPTVVGDNAVPINLYQWNGDGGWKVTPETVTVTLQ